MAAAGGPLALEAASSRSFFVAGRSGSDQADLTCGRLDLPARARYRPSLDLGRPGTLLSLELSGAGG